MPSAALALLLTGFASLTSASTATSAILHQPTDVASQARIFGFAREDGTPNLCSLHCDGRPTSQAQEDLNPVSDLNDKGRRLRLHVSDADVMAWASISGASSGDSVWIDRS